MIGAKQRKILAFGRTDYDALICYGAVRSGKTSLMMMAFVDWAMDNFAGQRFAICGVTVGSAVANVVDPWTELKRTKKRYRVRYTSSDKLLRVSRNGVENTFEVFGGKDEASYRLIQGRTLAGVFLDEVALMPQSFVNQATARCSVDGSKMWFSCNPDNPRHWFFAEWIKKAAEKNAYVIHFALDDNPGLSERIKERFRSMYHGVFYQRYILGLWVVAEGLVYQFDAEGEYACSEEEAAGFDEEGRPGYGHWFISADYGTVNPFAALLWRVTADRAYVVREYYFDSRAEGRRLTDEEHYANVERLAEGFPVTDVVVDPSAGSFKETVWRHGRFDVRDADNAVKDGIADCDVMLHAGLVKIAEGCTSTIAEMGLYRWDEKAGRDAPIKENDHAMDAMRYGVRTVVKYELPMPV